MVCVKRILEISKKFLNFNNWNLSFFFEMLRFKDLKNEKRLIVRDDCPINK